MTQSITVIYKNWRLLKDKHKSYYCNNKIDYRINIYVLIINSWKIQINKLRRIKNLKILKEINFKLY